MKKNKISIRYEEGKSILNKKQENCYFSENYFSSTISNIRNNITLKVDKIINEDIKLQPVRDYFTSEINLNQKEIEDLKKKNIYQSPDSPLIDKINACYVYIDSNSDENQNDTILFRKFSSPVKSVNKKNLSKVNKEIDKCDIKSNTKLKEIVSLQYKKIEQMRSKIKVPIDEIFGEFEKSKKESRELYKFQLLIYLILTQKTVEANVKIAFENLKKFGFNIDRMCTLKAEEIENLIIPCSFVKSKSRCIRNTIAIIKENYDGDPPEKLEQVMELQGMGQIMAEIYINYITNSGTYLSVNSNVHRVANRLKWITSHNLEETKEQLSIILPKEKWLNVNIVMGGFGQIICSRIDPLCNKCLLKEECDTNLNNRIIEEKQKRMKKKGLSIINNN